MRRESRRGAASRRPPLALPRVRVGIPRAIARSSLVAVVSALVFAQAPAFAASPVFSGSIEGKASLERDTESPDSWRYGLEEFSNLRFSVKVGDRGSVQGAVNAIASSGSNRELSLDGELERLYLSARGDSADVTAGLMRIAFGFGQGFRPTDILARPNPLFPDARSKGVLGGLVAWYPAGDLKVQGFCVDAADPYAPAVGYSRPTVGASADLHAPRLSAQALYAARLPDTAGDGVTQRIGASLKFDLLAGFFADALYTAPPSGNDSVAERLEVALSADYSFFDGKLYALGQYYWNGDGKLEGPRADPALRHNRYAFGTVSWRQGDYTSFALSCAVSCEDGSFQPAVSVAHDPFQGLTVTLTARMPLDGDAFGGVADGEFGPLYSGNRLSLSLGARMKF